MKKQMLKLYSKLCDEYNNKNLQRYCSFQEFLSHRYKTEKNLIKKDLIQDVINYALTDF